MLKQEVNTNPDSPVSGSFLKKVARAYVKSGELMRNRFCFVLPNKRSVTFFSHYLNTEAESLSILPQTVVNIDALVGSIVKDLNEVNRTDALFMLFQAYSEFSEDKPSFDRFLFWGNVLLNDFDEVDNYMVDPKSLFVNVERWKEIKSTYITDEQSEIIKRFWGESPSTELVDRFWEHIDKAGKMPTSKFLHLWEILLKVYERFHELLLKEKMTTGAHRLRLLCERLKDDPGVIKSRCYIFIGFDFPTGAELTLFRLLQKYKKADFYWDFNSPVATDSSNKISRSFDELRKYFPSRYDIGDEKITTLPKIKVIGVPSEVSQAKVVGNELNKWIGDNVISDIGNAIDTAVVLPDESLFLPVTHAIPKQIKSMNITMGYPWKLTPIAGLMGIIEGLQTKSVERKGRREYFYEAVERVVTNPLVRLVNESECDRLLEDIRVNRRYTVAGSYIEDNYQSLAPFFPEQNVKASATDAYEYFKRVTESLMEAISADGEHKLECQFIEKYRAEAEKLHESIVRRGIEMGEMTFINILRRIIDLRTANLEGLPLEGLQMMGLLETRCLDFSNVIITSMNERILPRKARPRSFIPENLRQAYGLPTIASAELRYGYYFYRLISRANNVVLTYDTRVGLTRSGDMSRYIIQLLYFHNKPENPITLINSYFKANSLLPEPIVIPKTDKILERLKAYCIPRDEGGKSLSASALKTYLTCPLKFCLKYLAGLSENEELHDYIEASTFGTIVHAVAENLYISLPNIGTEKKQRRDVDAAQLEKWCSVADISLQKEITRVMNKVFLKRDDESLDTPLEGEPKVLGKVVERIFHALFRAEKAIVPYTFIMAEKELGSKWRVNENLIVNFFQIIDRIDLVNGRLRIVDYKTGDTTFDLPVDLADMFEVGGKTQYHSLFQVLLYCILIEDEIGKGRAITPVIYDLFNVAKSGLKPIRRKINKSKYEEIDDYRMVRDEFVNELNILLEKIFDPQNPFDQTKNSENCKYCDFCSICGREVEK